MMTAIESSTHARGLLVLLPPGTGAETAAALLQAASGLAAAHGRDLRVFELHAEDEPAFPPAGLSCMATWWRFSHPGLRSEAESESILRLLPEMLTAAGCADSASLLILLPADTGQELGARLATRLRGVALGGAVDVRLEGDQVQVLRAAWGGRARATLASRARLCVASWRPAPLAAAPGDIAPALHECELQTALPPAAFTEPLAPADALPALEGARLVVSGGRGMQGEEGFAWLGRVAGKLGAALGGSLPAVDAGWVPISRQIGQSGKYVSPRTYLAVGISGTPQHLAGVSSEARIIAINKDAEAPIFAIADTGVVADWSELLPLLCAQIDVQLAAESTAPLPP